MNNLDKGLLRQLYRLITFEMCIVFKCGGCNGAP